MVRRLLDVRERKLAVGLGHVGHLVEPRDRVSHVPSIRQRFLPLFRKGIDAVRQVALRGEATVL